MAPDHRRKLAVLGEVDEVATRETKDVGKAQDFTEVAAFERDFVGAPVHLAQKTRLRLEADNQFSFRLLSTYLTCYTTSLCDSQSI